MGGAGPPADSDMASLTCRSAQSTSAGSTPSGTRVERYANLPMMPADQMGGRLVERTLARPRAAHQFLVRRWAASKQREHGRGDRQRRPESWTAVMQQRAAAMGEGLVAEEV